MAVEPSILPSYCPPHERLRQRQLQDYVHISDITGAVHEILLPLGSSADSFTFAILWNRFLDSRITYSGYFASCQSQSLTDMRSDVLTHLRRIPPEAAIGDVQPPQRLFIYFPHLFIDEADQRSCIESIQEREIKVLADLLVQQKVPVVLRFRLPAIRSFAWRKRGGALAPHQELAVKQVMLGGDAHTSANQLLWASPPPTNEIFVPRTSGTGLLHPFEIATMSRTVELDLLSSLDKQFRQLPGLENLQGLGCSLSLLDPPSLTTASLPPSSAEPPLLSWSVTLREVGVQSPTAAALVALPRSRNHSRALPLHLFIVLPAEDDGFGEACDEFVDAGDSILAACCTPLSPEQSGEVEHCDDATDCTADAEHQFLEDEIFLNSSSYSHVANVVSRHLSHLSAARVADFLAVSLGLTIPEKAWSALLLLEEASDSESAIGKGSSASHKPSGAGRGASGSASGLLGSFCQEEEEAPANGHEEEQKGEKCSWSAGAYPRREVLWAVRCIALALATPSRYPNICSLRQRVEQLLSDWSRRCHAFFL
jgi:hypothetical protein